MKHGELTTVEECLKGIKNSDKRDSLSTVYIAFSTFVSLFGGRVEFIHHPHVPEPYKAAFIFKEDKWTHVMEEAQESIKRFHHMGPPANDEEKAKQYKKIWDNSTLGEKLLGNINVMMEHLDGPIMTTSRPGIGPDCMVCFADKDTADYIKSIAEVYIEELKGELHES